MESLLANFDIDKPQNFWKMHPSWKIPKPFKDLFDSDKSKDKKESSLMMWSLVLMFEKSPENPWRNMDSEERLELINEDVMSDTKFDWKPYVPLIDYTQKILMTEEERNLNILEKYIEKRRKFLNDQQEMLDFDTMKQLDESVKRNADLSKELDRLKAAIMLTSDEGITKGGKVESLNETGALRT